MVQRTLIGTAGIFAVAAVLLGACTAPDIEGSTLAGTNAAGTGDSNPSSTSTCASGSAPAVVLTPDDPNKHPKCACAAKGGAARCVAKDKLPDSLSSQLDTCTAVAGGVCVPDKQISSGGGAPKTCKSPFGEGRCMSVCVPQVAQNADLLNRGEGDICDPDERCTPCLNPLKNNAPTHVCEIGKAEAKCDDKGGGATSGGGSTPDPNIVCPYKGPPVVDVNKFMVSTCGGGMRCVPAALVPKTLASQLKTCDQGLCAPEKSIAAGGQYVPKTCNSVAGNEGRCLNKNIPMIDAQKAQLTQDACDSNELCAPCFSPIDGKATGACNSVSCDMPKSTAKTFTGCCVSQGTTRAKCVPTASVPPAQASNLDDDGGKCMSGKELCVPNEMLQPNFKGPACSGHTFLTGDYTGVCLSDCLSFGFIASLGISGGNCLTGFKCAPCTNPLTGAATGAPGCPGT